MVSAELDIEIGRCCNLFQQFLAMICNGKGSGLGNRLIVYCDCLGLEIALYNTEALNTIRNGLNITVL